jgi:hypothetical protein
MLGWSKDKISDFDAVIPRGKSEISVKCNNSTSFSLGAIKQFLTKKANSSNTILEAMNFLNHLFSVQPSESFIPVGRKYFTSNVSDIKQLNKPIEFRMGLFQAVHFGGAQSLTINVDTTTGVFWNSKFVTLADLAARVLNRTSPTDLTSDKLTTVEIHRLSRTFKGLKYTIRHRGKNFSKRQHTISKIVKMSSHDHKFEMSDKSQHASATSRKTPRIVNVEQYMQRQYNLKLKYPEAVLALEGSSSYIPLELCFVVPVCGRHLFSYL